MRIVLFILILAGYGCQYAAAAAWRVLPYKTQAKFNAGKLGGNGGQIAHGMCRSESNPDYIYWSHDIGALWYSDDGGDYWCPCEMRGFYAYGYGGACECDPEDPCLVFRIVGHGTQGVSENWEPQDGLYRSSDAGTNWTQVLAVDPNFQGDWTGANSMRYTHETICFDRSSVTTQAQTWYAGINNKYIYKSPDAGVNWNQLVDINDVDCLHDVEVTCDGATIFIASEDNGLTQYTTAGGEQDADDLPAAEVWSVEVHPTDADIVWATSKGNGLYKSTDGGTTFVQSRADADDYQHVYINNGHPNTLYHVTNDHTYYTSDAGENWTECAATDPEHSRASIMPNYDHPNEAVAHCRDDIYKTTDGGATWTEAMELFTGYTAGTPFGIAPHRKNVEWYAQATADFIAVETRNGFRWWTQNVDANCGDQIAVCWTSQQTWIPGPPSSGWCCDYAPTRDSNEMVMSLGNLNGGNQMIAHRDSGGVWDITSPWHPNDGTDANLYQSIQYLEYVYNDADKVYSSNDFSLDGGETWQDPNFCDGIAPYIWGYCYDTPSVVWGTIDTGNNLMRSVNSASDFSKISTSDYNKEGNSRLCTPCPNDSNCVYILQDPNTGWGHELHVFNQDTSSYINLGAEASLYATEPNGFQYYPRYCVVDLNDPNILYVSMEGNGLARILRSTDLGSNWTDITGNLTRFGTWKIKVHPITGELLASSLHGLWVYPPPYGKHEYALYQKAVEQPYVARKYLVGY